MPRIQQQDGDNNRYCFGIGQVSFGDVSIIHVTKIYAVSYLNKTWFLSETVRGAKIGERAFRLALDFLSCEHCLEDDAQNFESHDFASRSLVNFLTM